MAARPGTWWSFLTRPEKWPLREVISRVAALCVVAAFLGVKVYQFDRFPGSYARLRSHHQHINSQSPSGATAFTPAQSRLIYGLRLCLWLLETGILLGYLAAYLIRRRAVAIAGGFMEVVFPFIISAIPMFIAMAPVTLRAGPADSGGTYTILYSTILFMMILGAAINLLGLLALRHSFSVMPEVRQLVTNGLFGWMRHPLYGGHLIMFLGSLLLRLHWYTVPAYLVFAAGQVWRARREEKKLAEVFPQYREYMKYTGMFLPLRTGVRRRDNA